ncbi:hypothetical protein AQ505_16835 [Pedobacter sp. PACM 27299]|nr:hypothetical protein AQ505_16835 [Pedobacter sp. PACM 27299]
MVILWYERSEKTGKTLLCFNTTISIFDITKKNEYDLIDLQHHIEINYGAHINLKIRTKLRNFMDKTRIGECPEPYYILGSRAYLWFCPGASLG